MKKTLVTEFADTLVAGLVSRTLNTASRWVERRRVMGHPFPGYYSFKYHPWCREVTDCSAPFVTVMKAAQLGLTEVAINRAFYTVDVLKRDVLYVLPTALNASDFSKSRFNTALSHSPYLKDLFTDTNTVGLKQAGGVTLYIRGSRGDSNLKSIPVSVLVLDEADEMDQKQIWLALERLSGQVHKFVFSLSTPTVPKYGIHKLYVQGTQEHYYFKCPRCGRATEFVWPDCVEICGETITDPDVKRSFLKCKECKGRIEHEEKPDFLGKGAYWESTATCAEEHRSFYINQLYSYTVTPADLVVAYFRGLGDEAAMVEFHNSKQGLPYIPDGGQVTDSELEIAVRRHTKKDDRPRIGGQRLITMGIDQGKWNHIVVKEFFVRGDRGLDINAKTVGRVLWEGKMPGDRFEDLDFLMREWQVLACVIDADPQINDARRFARRFPGYVYLCRYRRGVTGKELQLSEEEDGAAVVTVDRTNWLDASMGRFHSNRVELPADVSLEFREHIKALVRTYEKDDVGNPKAVYLNTGPDHFAHAFNYAEIALKLAAGVVSGEDVTERVL
jgi:transcription elongation factor Elf1